MATAGPSQRYALCELRQGKAESHNAITKSMPTHLAYLALGFNLGHERGHGGARQPAQCQLAILRQQRCLKLLLEQPRCIGWLQRLTAVGPRLAADVVQG